MSETKARKATEKPLKSEAAQSEVVTTPSAENATAAVVTTEEKGIFVYIGPSLPKGLLKKGSAFKGTRAEVLKHLDTVTAQYPEAALLLVTTDKLADAKARILKGGNLLSNSYSKLLDKTKTK